MDAIGPQLEPHRLDRTKVVARYHYDVRANWKMLAECRVSWTAQGLSPFDVSFDAGGWFRVARLPLREGYLTESLSGKLVAPVLGALHGADVGSLR